MGIGRPPAPRRLDEISRQQFWNLEDKISTPEMRKITGELFSERSGENVTYRDSSGQAWFRFHNGIYYAHSSIVHLSKK